MKYYKILALISIAFTACQSNEHSADKKESFVHKKNVFRINFNENVQHLNAIEANTNSELFICELIYDRLIQNYDSGRFESRIIKNYRHDSSSNTHHFELHDSLYYSNAESVIKTIDIEVLFQTLFKQETQNNILHSFFSSIQGYDLTVQYNTDRLPSGIEIQDNTHFSIKTLLKQGELFETLGSLPFSMQQNEKGSTFKIVESDDDISYLLQPNNANYKGEVKSVEIRFIKNEDHVVSEFLNNNLDIISFNPKTSTSHIYFDYLNAQIDKKYPDYQINISNKSTVEYATIYNVEDSTIMSKIVDYVGLNPLFSLKIEGFNSTYVAHSTTSRYIVSDTSSISPKIVLLDKRKQTNDVRKYYSSIFIVGNEDEVINQKEMFVVLDQTTISYNSHDMTKILEKLVDENKDNFSFKSKTVSIMSNNPYYYISDFDLKGIVDYQKLSDIVKVVNYKVSKKY